ncbi:hypothetical protein HZC33_02840 [Candidatus Wolfebacteria bacterium]|nr:hypothetical protein [Candidatus Wolfebacteria bacterium]
MRWFLLKLKQIQNSDEATKKRWVIIMSIAAMILIIGIWAAYLKFYPPGKLEIKKSESEKIHNYDFGKEWQNIMGAFGNAKEKIKNLNATTTNGQ